MQSRWTRRAARGTLTLLVCMAACEPATVAKPKSDKAGSMTSLALKSPAFAQNGAIPKKYTCEGSEVSPPLEWSGAPAGTKSFAFILDDPDAPDPAAPKRVWVHWVLYDIPAGATKLAEGASGSGLPAGTKVGKNDFGHTSYGGPCPPIGRHRYFHKLYALDSELKFDSPPTKHDVEAAMKGHVLAHAELVGTYQKG